MTEDMVAMAA